MNCGLDSIFHPLMTTNENAFNRCFIIELLIVFSWMMAACGGIDMLLVLKKKRFGSPFSPKNTGLAHYIRVNLVIFQVILFAIMANSSGTYDGGNNCTWIAFASMAACLLLVVTPLHSIETCGKPVASGVLLIFWPLLILVQSMIIFQDTFTSHQLLKSEDMSITVIELLAVLNSSIIFYMEHSSWWKPSSTLIFEFKSNGLDEELIRPNLIDAITYRWLNQAMVDSYKNQTVTQYDLPDAPIDLSSEESTKKLIRYYKADGKNNSLVLALCKAFGGTALISFSVQLVQRVGQYIKPQLLRLLIQYFGDKNAPILKGILVALSMFFSTAIEIALFNQFVLLELQVGLRCRSSLTSLIFQKSLNLSSDAKMQKSTGDIVNLMSVDVNRIQDVSQSLSILIIAPMELIMCIYSLWLLVGKASIAGVLVMFVVVPINSVIVKYSRRMNKKQMKLKDARTRIINEIISSVKSIKLYAWESPMLKRLFESRNNKELKNLKVIRSINQFGNFFWGSVPFFVSFATFASYTLSEDKPLTLEIIFPALTLLELLSSPLIQLPSIISSIIEASVAIGRVSDFLNCSEIDENLVKHLPNVSSVGETAVEVKDTTFLWKPLNYSDDENLGTQTSYFAIRNANFRARKGELNCIVGRVGSGKSAFLYGLLGNLIAVDSKDLVSKPQVKLHGSIAYCPQNPWIMNASFRENITFGHKFDPDFYSKTIDACQLLPDLAILPDGDDTQVGEKGISLSGGQKARLALARAVYTRADVFLLDDVLSAVDSHVGKLITEKVISKSGLLSTKTIILCTNSINVLNYSDEINMIEKGEFIETSHFNEIDIAHHPKLYELIEEFGRRTPEAVSDSSSSDETLKIISEENTSEQQSLEILSDELDKPPQIDTITLRRASIDSFKWDPLAKLLPNLKSGQLSETQEKGKVQWEVYIEYIKACSISGIIVWLLLLVSATVMSIISNYWLKHWAEKNAESGTNQDPMRYITIYALLGLFSNFLSLAKSVFLYVVLAIRGSRYIHDKMAKRILKAPMSFFERTPVGRIMNRFTNDINRVDDIMPRMFTVFFRSAINTFLMLGVIGLAMPTFLIVVSGLSYLYFYYQKYFVAGSRELKRLVSVSRSPIYAHLQESLTGVDTIRAFRQEARFFFINNANLDFNLKCLYMRGAVGRWSAVRLQFLGSIVVLAASTIAIISSSKGSLTAGMAGFAMSYALQVTHSFSQLVRSTSEIESNVVAVERCLEYCKLDVEEESEDISKFIKPPKNWPADGVIKFNNYSTKYRPNLDLILKNITLNIESGEKIGVVGRTGAGKSSLALSIFRIIEAYGGNIEIDSINTGRMMLFDLRNKLSIIPQDSQLFQGSIRDNLDPFGYYTDEEVWKALELAHLKEHVSLLEGEDEDKLKALVVEGGYNFSSGQRQLMSLARVLLKMSNSKILVLDEATAAVDVQTDKIIQETIRSEFKDKTIITIAHRLETVMDSNKILTLHNGEVKEFDDPQTLLADESGIFYSLCKKGGYI